MQIVIELPEQTYKRIRWLVNEDVGLCSPIDKAIAHGISFDNIEILKHRSYLEGFHKAYQMYYKMFDDIKAEIDELDFDFGDFYEYDHTEEIHEMIDKVWNKYIGKEYNE